jgi:gamma-glutamyltranspeptidase/glutathione hydrolase
MELTDVLQSAIRIAEHGFKVSSYTELFIALHMDEFIHYPAWSRIFLRDGRFPYRAANLDPVIPADRLVQVDLARTLRKLAESGPEVFYKGEIAAAIVDEMEKNGGLIVESDLASYKPRTMRPHRAEYGGYDVVTTRTHGSPTMIEILNILSQFDLKSMGHNTLESLRHIGQAMRLAFADRYALLWDPDSEAVPIDRLLSREYAAKLAKSIGSGGKSNLERFKTKWPEGGHTTHLCTVDKERNSVSLTNTMVGIFGSGVVIRNTGVLLNNGMFWFNPVPGTLASIRPKKWPLSAMAPAILLKDKKTFLSVGAPGARRVICGVTESIINVVDYGMTIQEAIAAPRVDYISDLLIFDSRIPEAIALNLEIEWHKVLRVGQEISSFNFASPTGIMVDHDGKLRGGVDPFKPDNTAAGY